MEKDNCISYFQKIMKLNQTKPFLCRNIGFFRKGNKSVTWGHLTNWADNRKNSLKTPFSPHIILEYNQTEANETNFW